MRWERSIVQRNADVSKFITNYLGRSDRRCALVCGAGFDPRTLALSQMLPEALRSRMSALCLREERPKPQPRLKPIADQHAARLKQRIPNAEIKEIHIFDANNNVVGGRHVVPMVNEFLHSANTESAITDVIVDISALSKGVFFPIFAQLIAQAETENVSWDVHLIVAENPNIDIKIRGEITDTPSNIHGFRSRDSLVQMSGRAVLWVPVLGEGNNAEMRLIYDLISEPNAPVDVSPIVPFPGLDPRRPDVLFDYYAELFEHWEIDPRHLLYAGESDPLDSYRSICHIDQLRDQTFGSIGGSSTIISPFGSKMLAVGLMLAGIERSIRTIYVEYRGYEELSVPSQSPTVTEPLPLTHLWLAGQNFRG